MTRKVEKYEIEKTPDSVLTDFVCNAGEIFVEAPCELRWRALYSTSYVDNPPFPTGWLFFVNEE